MHSLVTSIFLYACQSWTVTADIEKRITAVEMRCFRKLLSISHRDCVTNKEVLRNSGPYIYISVKTSWPQLRNANWSGMGTSQDHKGLNCQDSPTGHSTEEAGRKRDGSTTSQNGQALSRAMAWESQRTERDGESWLTDYLWCPHGWSDYGTSEVKSLIWGWAAHMYCRPVHMFVNWWAARGWAFTHVYESMASHIAERTSVNKRKYMQVEEMAFCVQTWWFIAPCMVIGGLKFLGESIDDGTW